MEPEIKTCVIDVTADGFAVLSSDDGTTHTVMRWTQTPKGLALEPVASYDSLTSAWVGLYGLREDVQNRLLD